MKPTETWTQARSRLANAVRYGRLDEAEAARRDLRAARAEQYLRDLVAAAPPLTHEQINHLRSILATE